MTKARKGGKTRRGGNRKRKGGFLVQFQKALAPYLLFQVNEMQKKKSSRKRIGGSRKRRGGSRKRRGGSRKRRGGRKSRRGGSRKRGGVANAQLGQVKKCMANKKPDGTYKTGFFGMNKAAIAKCDELLCDLDGKTWDQGQCHNF
jgi:hypothetical protein